MPKTKHSPGIHLHHTMVKRKVGAKYQYRVEYYWNIIASNGKEIARSSNIYSRKAGAVRSIKVAANIFKYKNTNLFYDHSKKDSPLKSYL